jgi:hypothetical protein
MTDDELAVDLAAAVRGERGVATGRGEARLIAFARAGAPAVRRSRTHRVAAFSIVCLCGSVGTAAAIVPHGLRIGGIEVFVRDNAAVETGVAPDRSRSGPGFTSQPQPGVLQLTIPGDATVWPGEPVTLEEANRRYRSRVRLPKSLRGPKALFWMEPPKSGQITAVWPASPQLPALAGPKVGLLFTQFRGSARSEAVIVKKTDVGRSQIEPVTVNKSSGSWIAGTHVVVIVDDSGERRENQRMAGSTLIWTDGAFTYRLEGAITKGEALRIARSVK